MLKNLAKKFLEILPVKKYSIIDGSIIPKSNFRLCGQDFKDNSFYIKSAENEVDRLINHLGLNKKSKILDIGCGVGRLATGLIRVLGNINYIGLDIDQKSINWCNRYISKENPTFKFKLINAYNERYNPKGIKIDEKFQFDIVSESIDFVYLFSVFSHMIVEDMKIYLGDISRILKSNGKVFFTTFVEENVPKISFNPENYIKASCHRPLHVVRYEKDYLFSIINDQGYNIDKFTHRTEDNGQSALYLSKK